MRYLNVIIAGLLILLALPALAQNPRDMKFSPLEFKPSEPVRFETDNGIIVHFYEYRELPVVMFSAYFKGGDIYDPSDKIGLSSITASLMRTGGAGDRTPDDIDLDLDFMAASVSSSASADFFSVGYSSLKKDIEAGFEIFSDIIMNPSFDSSKFGLEISNRREQIRRQNDNPGNVTRRIYYQNAYSGHPYSYYPTLKTIGNIGLTDIKNHHKRFYNPDNCIMAVAGDLSLDELKNLLNNHLAGWKKSGTVIEPIAKTKQQYKPGVYFAKRDINQAQLRLGHLCMDDHNPDRYAMEVVNFALGGGGFTSRMTLEVRTNAGLAYSVGTYLYNRPLGGTLFAYCQTRADAMSQAMNKMLEIIRQVKSDGITEDEMNMAKESIINSFVFNYDTPDEIADAQAFLELNGFPPDQLEKDMAAYQAVTLDDCIRVAKKYLDPDNMVIVITGNEELFDQPPSTFGPVTEVSMEIE